MNDKELEEALKLLSKKVEDIRRWLGIEKEKKDE